MRSGKMGEGSSDSEGPQSLAALSHVPPSFFDEQSWL